jgi:hypothetical protein
MNSAAADGLTWTPAVLVPTQQLAAAMRWLRDPWTLEVGHSLAARAPGLHVTGARRRWDGSAEGLETVPVHFTLEETILADGRRARRWSFFGRLHVSLAQQGSAGGSLEALARSIEAAMGGGVVVRVERVDGTEAIAVVRTTARPRHPMGDARV